MYPPPEYWANAAVVINRLRTSRVFFMAISPILEKAWASAAGRGC
jgi:hypothetical protein